jgi:hypothetical protein
MIPLVVLLSEEINSSFGLVDFNSKYHPLAPKLV